MDKDKNTYNGTDFDLLARNAYRLLIGELKKDRFNVQGNSFSHIYGTGVLPFNKYINSSNLVVSYLDGDGFEYVDAGSKIDEIIGICGRLDSFDVYISECLAQGPNNKKILLTNSDLKTSINAESELKDVWFSRFKQLYDPKLSFNNSDEQTTRNNMSSDHIVITGNNIATRCRFNLVVLPYVHNFDKKDITAIIRGDYSIDRGFYHDLF